MAPNRAQWRAFWEERDEQSGIIKAGNYTAVERLSAFHEVHIPLSKLVSQFS